MDGEERLFEEEWPQRWTQGDEWEVGGYWEGTNENTRVYQIENERMLRLNLGVHNILWKKSFVAWNHMLLGVLKFFVKNVIGCLKSCVGSEKRRLLHPQKAIGTRNRSAEEKGERGKGEERNDAKVRISLVRLGCSSF